MITSIQERFVGRRNAIPNSGNTIASKTSNILSLLVVNAVRSKTRYCTFSRPGLLMRQGNDSLGDLVQHRLRLCERVKTRRPLPIIGTSGGDS